MRKIPLAALFLSVPVICLAWNEPQDVRGFKFGSSPEEAIAVQNQRIKDLREKGEIVIDRELKSLGYVEDRAQTFYTKDKVGEVLVTLMLTFLDNKLSRISFDFPSKQFPIMVAAFLEKYGKPSQKKETPVQTKMGALYTNEELNWEGANILIVLSKYSSKITEGAATFGTKEWNKYLLERAKQKSRKAASDL